MIARKLLLTSPWPLPLESGAARLEGPRVESGIHHEDVLVPLVLVQCKVVDHTFVAFHNVWCGVFGFKIVLESLPPGAVVLI